MIAIGRGSGRGALEFRPIQMKSLYVAMAIYWRGLLMTLLNGAPLTCLNHRTDRFATSTSKLPVLLDYHSERGTMSW